ncbi:MAG: hypothetical protein K0S55_793 [Clostridia bacterium]|nr:hypothetical protein [Clostridia bacterium]
MNFYKWVNAKLKGKNEITGSIILQDGESSLINENGKFIFAKNGEKIADLTIPYSVIHDNNVIIHRSFYFDSAAEAVKPTLRIVKTGEKSIRAYYLYGELPSEYMVPTVLTAWKYKNLIEELEKAEAFDLIADLNSCYQYVDENNFTPEIKERLMQLPLWKAKSFYMARILNTRQKQIVAQALKKAGYTWTDYKKNFRETGFETAEPFLAIIPVDYELDDNAIYFGLVSEDAFAIEEYEIKNKSFE